MQPPDIEDLEMQGIIPRMVRTVFNRIETAPETIEFSVKISMIEIYMERIKDLLDATKDNLKIHEEKGKGVYVSDVTETYVGDEIEVFDIMKFDGSIDFTAVYMGDITGANKKATIEREIFSFMWLSQRRSKKTRQASRNGGKSTSIISHIVSTFT